MYSYRFYMLQEFTRKKIDLKLLNIFDQLIISSSKQIKHLLNISNKGTREFKSIFFQITIITYTVYPLLTIITYIVYPLHVSILSIREKGLYNKY